MSDKTPGQRAYEAYRDTPGVPVTHSWDALNNPDQRGWHRAAAAVMLQRNDGMTDDERRLYIAVRANVFGRLYVDDRGAVNRKAIHAAEEADHAGQQAVEMVRSGEFCPDWFEVSDSEKKLPMEVV